MDLGPEKATEGSRSALVCAAPPAPHAGRVTTVTIVLVAVWVGLIAGFLELGFLVIHRRFIEADFNRLGGDFVWLIPVGVTILVLLPAALFPRRRPTVGSAPEVEVRLRPGMTLVPPTRVGALEKLGH